jgi:hypothetical protein
MSILSSFLNLFRRKPAMNLDSLAGKMATIAAAVTKLSADLANAAALQAENDQLKAADAAAQAQAANIEAQADAVIAALPQSAPAA